MSKKIFLIAGEPSGDVLGGKLIQSLRDRGPEAVEIQGIGGDSMKAQGLESLLPMEELCVMGLWEVLGQLPRLLKLINGVVEEIEKRQPDVVVTIDLPDFNFQVASRLKKRGKFKGKIVHYVAPTVWAWRPGRAKKIAQFLDGLMCLFPFEPDYFTPHKLKSEFTGHPLIEHNLEEINSAEFKKANDIPEDAPMLAVFFGSRQAEFKTMGKTLKDTVTIMREQYPDLHLVVPTLPSLEYDIYKLIEGIGCPSYVITNEEKKWGALKACDAAVAVSGTAGLEIAYAGVPHAIAYKMHPVSWGLVKVLVKVKYAHLGNILLDQPVYPEFLQFQCDPIKIGTMLLKLLKVPEERQAQTSHTKELRDLLGFNHENSPSERAADFVLGIMKS